MRRVITESDIRRIVKRVLNEALTVDATYNKFYANSMSKEDFDKIIAADPTYNGGEQMGKFSQWLLSMVKKNKLNMNQLQQASSLLNNYNLNKGKFKSNNIDDYKSVDDLYNEFSSMKDELKTTSKRSQEKDVKKDVKKVYEDSKWLVVIPLTQESSCYYGKGTQWCTAAVESENYFETYNNSGSLYININKKTGDKYQFHFQREEFRDAQNDDLVELSEYDEESIAEYCGFSDGLIKFYENGIDINGKLTQVNNKIDIEAVYCEKSYYYKNEGGFNYIMSYDGENEYNILENEIYDNTASNYFIFSDRYLVSKNSDMMIFDLSDSTYVDNYQYDEWIKNESEDILEEYFYDTFLDELINNGEIEGVEDKEELTEEEKRNCFYDFFRDLSVSCQDFILDRSSDEDGYVFLCDCDCECYDIEFQITLKLRFLDEY